MTVDLANPMGRLLFAYRAAYEEEDLNFLRTTLKPGDISVDVGANQGLYTLVMSQAVGCQGRVIAFEPDREEFGFLQENITRNGCKNTTAVRAAVGENVGEGCLYVSPAPGGASLRRSKEEQIGEYVPVISLDDYFHAREFRHIDFIKIDVEGAELEVLKGAAGLLLKYKPNVMLEINPDQLQLFRTNEREVRQYLREHGYGRPIDPGDGCRQLEDSEEIINEVRTLLFSVGEVDTSDGGPRSAWGSVGR